MTEGTGHAPDRRRGVLIVVSIAAALSLPIMLGLALGALGDEESDVGAALEPATIWANVCLMRSQWEERDAPGASTTFSDRLHQPLHELAATLFEQSPSLASDVLETKGRVEGAIAKEASPSAAEVDELVRSVGAGLERLGGPSRRSCG